MSLTRQGVKFSEVQVYLFDHFYFERVDDLVRLKANILAEKIDETSYGKRTRSFGKDSTYLGKVGEFVFKNYLDYYWKGYFSSNVNDVNPFGGDITDVILGDAELKCDVKTRELLTDDTIAPQFDLRVPITELKKKQDVFVLTGFCPATDYGYVLGWCTWDELQRKFVRNDIKFPAKCVPVSELHPIQELEEYVKSRS